MKGGEILILDIVKEYIGDRNDDETLEFLTKIKEEEERSKTDLSAELEKAKTERDEALAAEKRVRDQYVSAFFGNDNAKETPTYEEEKIPGMNENISDVLYG